MPGHSNQIVQPKSEGNQGVCARHMHPRPSDTKVGRVAPIKCIKDLPIPTMIEKTNNERYSAYF
jgi:hypothetical protein